MNENLPLQNIPSIPSRAELKENTISRKSLVKISVDASADSWIAKSMFGYSILRNEDCKNILSDSRWLSAVGLLADLNPYTTQEFKTRRKTGMLAVDGEPHKKLKKIANAAFSKDAVMKMDSEINRTFSELINSFSPGDEFDISQKIFKKFPILVICDMIGLPRDRADDYSRWGENLLKNWENNYRKSTEEILTSQKEMDEYILSLIEERRNNPKDDLISRLVHPVDKSQNMSDEEIITFIETITTAGIDTVFHQLGSVFLLIVNKQQIWNEYRDNPQSRSWIIDEVIRITNAVHETGRIASQDINYRNTMFPKGTIVFLNITSANRDAFEFENPEDIQDGRKPNIAFGWGAHRCSGLFMAKAEITAAMNYIVENLPNIKVIDTPQYTKSNAAVYGPSSIMVRI
jgi:cytochrome P450 PksS